MKVVLTSFNKTKAITKYFQIFKVRRWNFSDNSLPGWPSNKHLVKSNPIKKYINIDSKLGRKKNSIQKLWFGGKNFTINWLSLLFFSQISMFSIMFFDFIQCWVDGRPGNGHFFLFLTICLVSWHSWDPCISMKNSRLMQFLPVCKLNV